MNSTSDCKMWLYLFVLVLAAKDVFCTTANGGSGWVSAYQQQPLSNSEWPQLGRQSHQWKKQPQTTLAPLTTQTTRNVWSKQLPFGFQPSPFGLPTRSNSTATNSNQPNLTQPKTTSAPLSTQTTRNVWSKPLSFGFQPSPFGPPTWSNSTATNSAQPNPTKTQTTSASLSTQTTRNAWSKPSPLGPPTWSNNTGYVKKQVQKFETLATSMDVTDDDLRQFTETLLLKDVNSPSKYVVAKYQSKTSSRSPKDEAPEPLLQMDQKVFEIATLSKLSALHDNYILDTRQAEEYTPQEKEEEDAFLESIMSTPIMDATRDFLIQSGKLSNNAGEFKKLLEEIWFGMYPRGTRTISSSGFEHVFVAEIKKNEVSGMHNWLFFKVEEDRKNANYLGYMRVVDFGEKGSVVKLHFTYKGADKPVGSMFVGTSPELEMALYTTCFVLRADRVCPIKLSDKKFIIRTFTYRYKGRNMIGSAFPEI